MLPDLCFPSSAFITWKHLLVYGRMDASFCLMTGCHGKNIQKHLEAYFLWQIIENIFLMTYTFYLQV